MEKELVEELDKLTINQNYANRSEAIRSLVRKELVANGNCPIDFPLYCAVGKESYRSIRFLTPHHQSPTAS